MNSSGSMRWADIAVRLWVRDALDSYPGGDRARQRADLDRLNREYGACHQRADAAERRAATLERELAAIKASRTWRAAEQIQRIRKRLPWKP